MTPSEPTPLPQRPHAKASAWATAATALGTIVAVVVLALTGHPEVATAAAGVGGAVSTAGGIRVTVNIRR
ncbi:hypothetical protein [Streptomyces sp. NPDC037389]|uniref:hypothetical protein n=1 Tax=Streptomyces sp. NPDC037389 TaxID=3155369 RepID=UPI0033C95A81